MLPHEKDQRFSTVEFDQALQAAREKFKFRRYGYAGNQLTVNKEGVVHLDNLPCKITEGGIRNLCGTLRIPDPFANRIPTDLLINNINRLAKETGNDEIQVYFDDSKFDDPTIVDVNKKNNLQSISAEKVISYLPTADRSRFMFENHLLKIEIVPEDGLEVDSKGQIHKIGRSILHYPTAKNVTQAYMSLWTMVCSNGMIAPREFFREKLNLKSTSEADVLLANFFKRIAKSVMGKEELEEKFKQLHESFYSVEELGKLIKTVKRKVGKDEVDNVLGEGADIEYNDCKDKEPDFMTGINRYNIFYNITNYASNITKSARLSRSFQTYAGKMLFLNE